MSDLVALVRGVPERNELVFSSTRKDVDVRSVLVDATPGLRRRREGRAIVVDALDFAELSLPEAVHSRVQLDDTAKRMLVNRRRALSSHGELHERLAQLKAGRSVLAKQLLAGCGRLAALDDHQWVNVAALTFPGGYGLALFDEQGAGKTVTIVHAVDVLAERREIMTTVVVAPKSMLTEWEQDVLRFMGDLYEVRLLAGSRRDRLAILASTPDIVVANFETVVSLEAELVAYARRFRGRALLVVDESFNVKSDDSRRTQAVRRLREEFDRAVVLCGTPAPNRPHDVVAQMDLVDFGITFRQVAIPEDRDDAVPVVREALENRALYLRHLKVDVLPTLPSKTFHRVSVPFGPRQLKAYQSALNDLVLDLRNTSDEDFSRRITTFLARRAALLRLCSDPAGVVAGFDEVPAKFGALEQLLDGWIRERGEKVVLWSFYRATVERAMSSFSRFHPVRYDGAVSSIAERREAVRRFQEDDETMLFVGNAAAAGAGLTLHRSRVAVYESLSNQAAHFLQSVDRIHRRGQLRDVEYVVLLCAGSIEEDEFERLLGKEARSRDLLGDSGGPPVTRQSLLGDLTRAAARLEPSAAG